MIHELPQEQFYLFKEKAYVSLSQVLSLYFRSTAEELK